MKHPFRCKNGRYFLKALTIAADDPNIVRIYMDNYEKEETNPFFYDDVAKIKQRVIDFIEKGQFKDALVISFDWYDSNEGKDFWRETYNKLEDKK